MVFPSLHLIYTIPFNYIFAMQYLLQSLVHLKVGARMNRIESNRMQSHHYQTDAHYT
jgi:hypothetical protein